MNCHICEKPIVHAWTDSHGISSCMTCGAFYRLFHYENDKRVEKPPTPLLEGRDLEAAKAFWAEKHSRVWPMQYDIGVGRNGRSYSGATDDEARLFYGWLDEKYPAYRQEAEARKVADATAEPA